MSTAPEASIILRSMTVIEAGASASGCCRRVALSTGGTWLRNRSSVAGTGSAACRFAGARIVTAMDNASRHGRALVDGLNWTFMGGSRFLVVSLGQPVAAPPRGARILTDSTVFPQKTPVSGSIIAGWDSQMTHGAVPAAGPENKRPGWIFRRRWDRGRSWPSWPARHSCILHITEGRSAGMHRWRLPPGPVLMGWKRSRAQWRRQ